MEVKGTSLRGTIDFVKANFPDKYEYWLSELPDGAKKLFSSLVLTNKWYSVQHGLIEPIETISRLFYNGNDWFTSHLMGQNHAEKTLTGIYKFFIQLNSPRYILERGAGVLHTYFQPLTANIKINNKNSVSLIINPYPYPHIIFEASVAGWTEKALEVSGGKNVRSELLKTITKGDDFTEIVYYWD